MTVGERLRAARKKLRKSQSDVARALGCKQPTVSSWESDDSLPRADIMRNVARVYGLRPEQLLPGGGR